MQLLPIETENKMFGLYLYPFANKYRDKQQDFFWTEKEIKVEKDKQDYLVEMTEDELNLVKFTLQLFVELEQGVGDIWGLIADWFPHSEIEGACVTIEAMEKGVHAFFYQKMSDVLLIDPHETARLQREVKVFKEKLAMINKIINNASNNKLLALATLSMIEQVLLFGNFAMLKSFQANGNNKIVNTINGVNFVMLDEDLHGEFARDLYQTYLDELLKVNPDFNIASLHKKIKLAADDVIAHEDAVIDYLLADGKVINGISNQNIKSFIRERMNYVFENLGIAYRYDVKDTEISSWFFQDKNALSNHDFFVKGTNEYTRDWSESSFSILDYLASNDEEN